MTAPQESFSLAQVVLLDAGVLRDIAGALNGHWQPADEEDTTRRNRLVAAARLRIYAEHDTRGWFLTAPMAVRAQVLEQYNSDWGVEFVAALEEMDAAPIPEDVAALTRMFREDDALDVEAAEALALASLYEPVRLLVTHDPRSLRHMREHDVPPRLEIISLFQAVDRLEIAPGEEPEIAVPAGVVPSLDDPWWVP